MNWLYCWMLCALCFLLWRLIFTHGCFFLSFWLMTIFSSKKLKMQNTVFGCKKGSKIQSDKVFWSVTSTLWVVSFAIFDLWPFYKGKNWKRQNTVFGYKKWSKIQSDKIFSSVNPKLWVVSFATFGLKSFLTKGRNPMFSRTFRRIFLGMIYCTRVHWMPKYFAGKFSKCRVSKHKHF